MTYRQAAPDKPPAWAPTPMGRAVYDSGLATNIGMRLYDELSKAEAGLVLGEPLHLVYIIMPEHPFKIFGWPHWGRLFRNLTGAQKKARLCSLLAVFLVWTLFGLGVGGRGVHSLWCSCFLGAFCKCGHGSWDCNCKCVIGSVRFV